MLHFNLSAKVIGVCNNYSLPVPMLIGSLMFLILSSAVALRRDKSILFSRVAMTISALCFMVVCYETSIALNKGMGLFGGLYHSTPLSQMFNVFILVLFIIILQLTSFYPRKILLVKFSNLVSQVTSKYKHYKKIIGRTGEHFKIIEYPLILLFIIAGASLLMTSSDIVSIFLSIELQSYGLYLVSTIYRNSERATSAGLTYFLLGGLSSCFILLGTSLIYCNSGITSLDALYVITSLSDVSNSIISDLLIYKPHYISLSLVIMSVGFLFKVSAAPFHFWSPDVYDNIPTIVTAFVAIIAKISIFIFLLEIVHYTNSYFFAFDFSWTYALLVSCLLSLVIGSLLGLSQSRIKRLFAYSTVSHLGFILLAISVNTVESSQAFIFYLMQYSIVNLNAFILLIAIGFSFFVFNYENNNALKELNNSPIQLTSQIKGYFYINPVLALSLCITLFSFVGIPPLIGFFAKQMVLSAALDDGYVFLCLVAIITSVISAVYYLDIIKQVFFERSDHKLKRDFDEKSIPVNDTSMDDLLTKNVKTDDIDTRYYNILTKQKYYNIVKYNKAIYNNNSIKLAGFLSITISLFTMIISLFIFNPQEWLSMANIFALIIFNP